MILAACQPAYLPSLSHFARIAASDVFVILDIAEVANGGSVNRARIKTRHGEQWLTVPLRLVENAKVPVYDIKVDQNQKWQEEHLRAIEDAYAQSEGRRDRLEKLSALIRGLDQVWLTPLCRRALNFFLSEYGIATRIQVAPIKKRNPGATDLALDLCRDFKADTYLCDAGSRANLDLPRFEQAKVKVVFQDWQPPVYPQPDGPFIADLSIVDLWLNTDANPFTSLVNAHPA